MVEPPERDHGPELRNPLDFLSQACDRLKRVCALMAQMTSRSDVDTAHMVTLIEALKFGFPLQFADEAEDLIPMLRLRARRTDEVEPVLRDLTDMHSAARQQLSRCAADLESLRHGALPAASFSLLGGELSVFAAALHRHLALVKAVVLPIARLRLSPEDLVALGRGLAERRGLPSPVEAY